MISLTPTTIVSILVNCAVVVAPVAFYVTATIYLIKHMRSK